MKNNPQKSKRGGKRPGAGRPKGSPNKVTGELKSMILTALERVGGIDYLETQADENPKAFMALLGRILPMQVAGDPDGSPISISFRRAAD